MKMQEKEDPEKRRPRRREKIKRTDEFEKRDGTLPLLTKIEKRNG